MERLRRLTTLWNYLPGFRAVAESQHLPTASQLLFVSPSALSRTIRLLEEDLGRPLFDRVGRNLELNAAGQRLLSGVRDAMRLVDEVLAAVADERLVGPVYIGASSSIAAAFVLPALRQLREDHPDLRPCFRNIEASDLAQLLLRGYVDLVLTFDPIQNEDIELHRLGLLSSSVCCSQRHPLARKKKIPLAELADHPFITPEQEDDGWPPEIRRNTVLSGRLSIRIEACRRGDVLAVIPDVLAGRREGLVPIFSREIRSVPLYAARRRAVVEGDKAGVVLSLVRAEVKAKVARAESQA